MDRWALIRVRPGLDENVQPNPSWPSRGRVLEVMAIASAMGASEANLQVVRDGDADEAAKQP